MGFAVGKMGIDLWLHLRIEAPGIQATYPPRGNRNHCRPMTGDSRNHCDPRPSVAEPPTQALPAKRAALKMWIPLAVEWCP